MINFREIFNVYYGYGGFLLVFGIVVLLFFINKNWRENFKMMGKVTLGSGIVVLVVSFIIKGAISLFDYKYRIFIYVIADNFLNKLNFFGIVFLLMSGCCLVIYKLLGVRKVAIN